MHVVAADECTLVPLCTSSLTPIGRMLPQAMSSTGMVVLPTVQSISDVMYFHGKADPAYGQLEAEGGKGSTDGPC